MDLRVFFQSQYEAYVKTSTLTPELGASFNDRYQMPRSPVQEE